MKNQVSIIINGTRYDAVDIPEGQASCDTCAMEKHCDEELFDPFVCENMIGKHRKFEKSTKSFEP